MPNNILISTSMLSSIWEKERKDTIDLLLPFLRYVIAIKTKINNLVDIGSITNTFKEEFGYNDIPINVINQMLNRLTKMKILKKENNKFYLIKDLNTDINKFKEQKTKSKEETNTVVKELDLFLEKNYKKIDIDIVEKELVSFFSRKGTTIFENIDILGLEKQKGNEFNYFIGQFILKEHNKKSHVFDYLIKMLEGFFISTVISLQPDNNNIIKAKFKDVSFYLDTRLILNLLGCNTKEEKEAAIELITILKNTGAKICCFEHNIQEAQEVLFQYENSVRKSIFSGKTLYGLQELNYSADDVHRIYLSINEKITKFNINIVGTPIFNAISEEEKKYLIDEQELEEYLKNGRIVKENANKIDVLSISAICRLRKGVKTNTIENSKAIFVTTNKILTILVNRNKDLGIIFNNTFFPIITDLDLSAIVWIKNFSIDKNYSKLKLIENARLSVEPSSDLLKIFFDKLDKIKKEGNISSNEAFILRTDIYTKRNSLMETTYGNEQNLTDERIYDIKDKVLEKYYNDVEKRINKKEADSILKEIQKEGEKNYSFFKKLLTIIAIMIFIGLIVLTLKHPLYDLIYNKVFSLKIIIPIIILLFQTLDFFIPKFKYTNKLIEKISNKMKYKKEDKMKEHYKKIFPHLFDD